MNYKQAGLFVAVISAVIGAAGLGYTLNPNRAVSSSEPSQNQTASGQAIIQDNDGSGESNISNRSASGQATIQEQSGSGSNVSAGRDIAAGRDLTINQVPEPYEVPSFEGQILPWDTSAPNVKDKVFEPSREFTNFIQEHDKDIVYLDIYPYYTDQQLEFSEGWPSPELVCIPFITGGASSFCITIEGIENGDVTYTPALQTRRITGYFKIAVVHPYMGGGQRATIRAVKIEDVPR